MERQYYVYILTSKNNNVLYTGVTNSLSRRVFEHKQKLIPGFTKKYNLIKLVYYEIFDNIYEAIKREKQIKGGSREDKIRLINKVNKDWKDLYEIAVKWY
jgi:putative endonuclease